MTLKLGVFLCVCFPVLLSLLEGVVGVLSLPLPSPPLPAWLTEVVELPLAVACVREGLLLGKN